MSVYTETIKHHATSATILAYLALHDTPVKCARIADYLWLMHEIPHECTRVALKSLTDKQLVLHVARAYYFRRWEFAAL